MQTAIEGELRKFFRRKRREAEHIDPATCILVDAILEFTLRPAKRIRPFLVWLGFGSRTSPRLISAMLAIELFHTFALIHDDIMDKDDQRRGGPTIHKQLGISLAILAGDLALVWADELINSTQNKKAIRLFGEMKEEVAVGQTLDVMKQGGNKNISQDKINELKTAWYSVVRPLQIGAALAGASEKTFTNLAQYGVPVGKLFQLKDDLMDKEISQQECTQKIIPLQKQVDRALGMFPDARQLAEFARFVIERES